jgi:hypothetical protein
LFDARWQSADILKAVGFSRINGSIEWLARAPPN